jgi:hypothetical protein
LSVPQASRRRKNLVVPADVSAKVAEPATARYGFLWSDTAWLVVGDVIVTDVVAESAAPAAMAAASAASASSTVVRLISPPWLGAEWSGAFLPKKATKITSKRANLFLTDYSVEHFLAGPDRVGQH